jgi:hypothetical protein
MNGKKHNKGGATANKVGNNIRRKAGEAENAEFSRFHKAQIKPIRSVDFKANCCVPRFSNGEPRGAGDLLRGSDLAPSM